MLTARRPLLLLGLAALALGVVAAGSSQGAVRTGTIRGTAPKAPASKLFEPAVRAYRLAPTMDEVRVRVARNGRFSVRVAPGLYGLVVSGWVKGKPKSVVRIVRVKRGATARLPAVKALASPHASPFIPPTRLSVGRFRVTDPSLSYLKNGLADVGISDAPFDDFDKCKMGLYEDRKYGRFGDILREIALGKSRFADPEFRRMARQAERNLKLHAPTHRLNAVIDRIAPGDNGPSSGTFQLVDLRSGKVVWSERVTAPSIFDLPGAGVRAAVKRLCNPTFEVTLAVTTDANFATHVASGSLTATLTASKNASGAFTGSAPIAYQNVTFTSKTDCTYNTVLSTGATFDATIALDASGLMTVKWSAGDGTAALTTSASVQCPGDPPPPPIPGQPGPRLLLPQPTEFTLPLSGGQKAVSGGFQAGGDGWTHNGTITVVAKTT